MIVSREGLTLKLVCVLLISKTLYSQSIPFYPGPGYSSSIKLVQGNLNLKSSFENAVKQDE